MDILTLLYYVRLVVNYFLIGIKTKDLINALESDKENSKNKEILNLANLPVY